MRSMREGVQGFVLLVALGLIFLGLGVGIDHYAKPLPEVENTIRTAEWAEENLNMCVCDAWTCEMAVQEYMKAHNLTPEEFPYVCWRSDEMMPLSRSEKAALVLGSLGFVMLLAAVFYGVIFVSEAIWDKLRRRHP